MKIELVGGPVDGKIIEVDDSDLKVENIGVRQRTQQGLKQLIYKINRKERKAYLTHGFRGRYV